MKGQSPLQTGERNTIELRIPARPENLALARLALAGVATVAGARDDVIADLKVAVTEACTNAILHAYSDREGSVMVRYRIAEDALEVEIEDDGAGFDPGDPRGGGADSGGQAMGLMIIRELTDEVVIESDPSGSRIAFARSLRDA
jgi:serine/threonine-protein kinase RsbW